MATTVGPSEEPGEDNGRVLSWNLHYGVSPAGAVDLEAIARTIEAQDVDTVLLQEVSRGWVMGGGVDMATWLSNRLDLQLAFAPAADRQFGNAIMTWWGPWDVEVHDLPYGAGPQQRSALSARVPLGHVTSVHLQHRERNTPTRLRQLETLLDTVWAHDRPMVVGGDLNAEPGWPEIDLLTEAGFVSAIDEVGDPAALTSPNPDPQHRIDWVLGRDVTFRDARVVTEATSSDHLPLVVTVEP